jgi:hypothetical protein
MDMHFTLTIGKVVTKTRPQWNIPLMTEYSLLPTYRFFIIMILGRMLFTDRLYYFRDLSFGARVSILPIVYHRP